MFVYGKILASVIENDMYIFYTDIMGYHWYRVDKYSMHLVILMSNRYVNILKYTMTCSEL